MICKNCGKENSDTRETCIYCKQKLNGKTKHNFKWLTITTIILSIVAVIMAIITGSSDCSGWGCLGRGLGVIFLSSIAFALWILYGIIIVIVDFINLDKKNKDAQKFKKIFTCLVLIPSLLLILGDSFFYYGEFSISTLINNIVVYGVVIIILYYTSKHAFLNEDSLTLNTSFIVLFSMILLVMYFGTAVNLYRSVKEYLDNKKVIHNRMNNYSLLDMATNVCDASFSKIYSTTDFKSSGIFECNNDSFVYYISGPTETCDGAYDCGDLYEIGYSFNSKIEEQFENGVYIYKKNLSYYYPSKLIIALKASSKDDLINQYAENLYNLAKDENLDIVAYYVDSLEDISSTYDKLSLLSDVYKSNSGWTDLYGTVYGKYYFFYKNSAEILNQFFSKNNTYPNSIKKASENKNYIIIKSNNNKAIDFNSFKEQLNSSTNLDS